MEQLIDYLEYFSTFLPLIAGIITFKKLDKALRLFFLFWVITSVVETITWGLSFANLNNMWLINFYTLFEAIILLYFLIKITGSKFLVKLFIFFIILYSFYWIYANYILWSIFQYNSTDKFIKGILLILSSGLTLLDYTFQTENDLRKSPLFWILGGIFFYFSLTLIIFSTANWIFDNSVPTMNLSWIVHSYIVTLTNILFTIGFLCTLHKNNFSSL